jgi:hypothetical protein
VTEIRCARCARPVGDRLTLCQPCADTLIVDLLSIPGLLAELTITRAGLAKMGDRNGGRSAETPIPVRANSRGNGIWIDGDRQVTAIHTTIATWARALAEDLGVDIPIGAPGLVQITANNRRRGTSRRAPATIVEERLAKGKIKRTVRVSRIDGDALADTATPYEQAAVWLACHPHELRAHEAAAELCRDIAGASAQIRRIIDAPDPPRQIGPCPECGVELRVRADERGDLPTWVHCRECGEQHEVRHVQALALAAVRDRLFTIAEITRITGQFGIPIASRTLHRWAEPKAGKLTARGYLHHDPTYGTRITDTPIQRGDAQVFRLGDVLDIAAADRKGSAA